MPTIFYSWQSDLPNSTSRGFIEDALEKALKQLNKEIKIEEPDRDEVLRLDKDTQDVPGSPEIVQAILKKIVDAAVFVADVTFVGRTSEGKSIPNPNVLIEYGWALKVLGLERILPVMNEAFGKASWETLPFDMRHVKWPVRYHLPENAGDEERKKAKQALVQELAARLQTMSKAGLLEERKAQLSVFLVTGQHNEVIDKGATLETVNLAIPRKEDFPPFGVEYSTLNSFAKIGQLTPGKNEDYYYEYAQWFQETMRMGPLRLAVKNGGGSVATGVRVVLSIEKTRPDLQVLLVDDLLSKPTKNIFEISSSRPVRGDVSCETTPTGWRIVADLGKIQATDLKISRDCFYVGADSSIDIPLLTQIFSDELSRPLDERLVFHLSVEAKSLSVDELILGGDDDQES